MSLTMVVALLASVYACVMAFAVLLCKRKTFPHWSFALSMILLSVESIFGWLASTAVLPETTAHWLGWKILMASLIPGFLLPFCIGYAQGNSAQRILNHKIILLFFLIGPFINGTFFFNELIRSVYMAPEDGHWLPFLGFSGMIANTFLLVGAVISLMYLEQTFRASVGTMRWRIKYMVIGLGLLFFVRAYTASQYLLFGSLDVTLQFLDTLALGFAGCLTTRSLLRSGHFEVTLYPSQTIIQGSLTIMVAGIYLFLVGVFGKALAALDANAPHQMQIILASLAILILVLLVLSNQVRLHFKRFISRHFHRPEFDYRSLWRSVISQTVQKVEQKDLCESVVRLTSEIFHSLSVTLWLIDKQKHSLEFGASSFFTADETEKLLKSNQELAEAVKQLGKKGRPVDLDASRELWVKSVRNLQPMQFQRSGNLIGAPLIAGDQLLGILLLGDRVGGARFSLQELDLLSSINEHVAACLLNVQLSKKMLDSKQLEAIQTMSTFVVHDLKNTASTLSLMLKNLPIHFDDPLFRKDTLRGMATTVDHLNNLIGRLTLVRKKIAPTLRLCNLNTLVEEVCLCLQGDEGIEIEKSLNADQSVFIDLLMIRTVITNLILNARDATGPKGSIAIKTYVKNAHTILEVQDNGCGMGFEFIQNSLFMPFKTTKKNGIGIGLFHCKMIIDAHDGRIEVESKPDHGTVFRVYFPMQKSNIPSIHLGEKFDVDHS